MDYLKNLRLDFMTACYPKEHTEPIINRMQIEYNADKRPFSILVLDMDHFKAYNDKYGHVYGDELLRYFTGTLHKCFKGSEYIPIRFGGDEFVVVFPGKERREALALANSFRSALKKSPFVTRAHILKVTFSGGIATYPRDSMETLELLDKADKAMYYSKTHGRGRVTHYEWLRMVNIRRLVLAILAVLLIAAGFALNAIWQHPEKMGLEGPVKIIREKIEKLGIPMLGGGPADRLYMKSGRVFKGRIMSENADSITFRLGVHRSNEGSVIIKKSEMSRIERAEQPPK